MPTSYRKISDTAIGIVNENINTIERSDLEAKKKKLEQQLINDPIETQKQIDDIQTILDKCDDMKIAVKIEPIKPIEPIEPKEPIKPIEPIK